MDSKPIERRQYPRVRLVASRGATQPADVTLLLRDISLGGFCLESTLMFALGTPHVFAFSLPGGRPLVLIGTARHCLRINWPEGQPAFLCGFEFVHQDPAAQADLARLLEGIRDGEHDVGIRVKPEPAA